MRVSRVLACLIAALLSCTACAHLPGEEHAFAVVLGVELTPTGEWLFSTRIPSYQEEGNYQTLTAQVAAPEDAYTLLDAAAPMRLHYGQLRMIVVGQSAAESPMFPALLRELSLREETRRDAQLVVTAATVPKVLDAMQPKTGTRLSKSLDVLLESRQAQGIIPASRLGDVVRCGDRQAIVTPILRLNGDQFELSGAALFATEGTMAGTLSPEETQLFSLITGQMKKGPLLLPSGTAELLSFSCTPKLSDSQVECAVIVDLAHTNHHVSAELGAAIEQLAAELREARCDAFGLARQTVRRSPDAAAWHDAGWTERCLELPWRVTVTANPPTR